jgi:RHS repeat-associated protein
MPASPWKALHDELARLAVASELSANAKGHVMAVGASFHASTKGKPLTPAEIALEKASRAQILDLIARVQQSEKGVSRQLASNQTFIDRHHFTARIEQRQQATVAQFDQGVTALAAVQQKLLAANSHNNNEAWHQGLQQLQGLVAQWQPAAPEVSPHNTPWTTPHLKVRAPHQDKDDYLQHLSMFDIKPIQLAYAGSMPIPPGTIWPTLPTMGEATVPGDTAASIDAPLTPAIQAQAAALHYNPSQIYYWVYNNISYVPYYGSLQGADFTLKSMRGNDMDIASLLIALFRASNLPARYVYGTINVPMAKMQNWLGGVPDANAVLSLLAQGGVPSQGITSGGQITSIQLEHVWVEAFVNYVPSRGVVQRVSDTWLPLDASFKQYKITAPMNIPAGVPFNAQGLLQQLQGGATVNSNGVVQNLNGVAVQQAINSYQQNIQTWLSNYPNVTTGTVLGGNAIVPDHVELLPSVLDYPLVAVAGDFDSLPAAMRWKWRLNLYGSAQDQSNGAAQVTLQGDLPSLLGHRISVGFRPSTSDDSAVLASLLPQPHANGTPVLPSEFPQSVPAYLVNMTAQLFEDGQLVEDAGNTSGSSGVASSSSTTGFPLGTPLQIESAAYDPGSQSWEEAGADTVNAGETHIVTLDSGMSPGALAAQQGSLDALTAQISSGNLAAGSFDSLTGVLLQQMGQNYFGLLDSYEQWMESNQSLIGFRRPSWARIATEVDPEYTQGIILSATFPGAQVRLDHLESAIVGAGGAQAAIPYRNAATERLSLYSQTALQNSLQAILPNGNPVSAVHALATALNQGQALYDLNQGTYASLSPNVTLNATETPAVTNAVAVGQSVLLSPNTVSISGSNSANGWTGRGLLYQDPLTGNSRFTVTNGATALWYDGMGTAWLAFGTPGQIQNGSLPAITATRNLNVQLQAALGSNTNLAWTQFTPGNDLISGDLLTQLNAQTQSTANLTSASPNLLPVAGGILATDYALSQAVNVNLDAPPVISSTPGTTGSVNVPYNYAVQATSPQGHALTYQLVNGPSLVSVAGSGNAATVSWAKPLIGSWPLTVRVSDGQTFTTQSWTLNVSQGAPTLNVSVAVQPQFVAPGGTVTVQITTTGGLLPENASLTVDGQAVTLLPATNTDGSVSGTLDSSGTQHSSYLATLTASSAVGNHALVATVSDGNQTITQTNLYAVNDPADSNTAAVATITAPVIDATLTSPTPITGTATAGDLSYYLLMLKPVGTPDSSYVQISKGTQSITNGTLGTLDPSTLQNGIYTLALVVFNSQGNQTGTQQTIEINKNLKIGQLILKYTDVTLTAPGGIPLQVTRTYDTRRDGQALDFGYGWAVGYQDITIRKNIPVGLSWQVTTNPQAFLVCLVPVGAHKVAITLPDGTVYNFSASNSPQCQSTSTPLPQVQFTALDNSATLTAINAVTPIQQGNKLVDPDTGAPWDPTQFNLTLQDGTVYTLDQNLGIQQIKTPFGNTITFANGGITSNDGQSITFTRDAQNRITAITDPTGKSVQYAYDANGNLSAVTDRLGQRGSFAYNQNHAITSYTDPRGVVMQRLDYDDQGRLISITDSQGRATQITTDIPNNVQVVKDRMGNVTTYTYDDQGNVTQKVDAMGNKTSYTYDVNGNEASVTDALGHTTTTTYGTDITNPGSYNKELAETDALGHQKTFKYTPNGNPVQSTDLNGNVTSYEYFGNGTAAIKMPAGFSATGFQDGQGHMTGMQIAGQNTQFTNDSSGKQLSKTSPLGVVTSFTYDGAGNQNSDSFPRTLNPGLASASTAVAATQRTYDANGNILTSVDAQGQKTTLTYNAANLVASETDSQGHTLSYAYDDSLNLVQTTYPDGTTESNIYDANKNLLSTTDRSGHTTQYTYDPLKRLTKTTNPDGSFTSTQYDAVGHVVATTNSKGQGDTASFDAAGRQITSTDANGNTLTYSYDANGNRTSAIDANGQATQYQYDGLNRLIQTTLPDGAVRAITYRTDGAKQSETDENGSISNFQYDAEGKLTGVTVTSPSGAVLTTYTYDEAGNKVAQTDALGHVTRWQYNLNNRLTGRTLPDGRQESFLYDAAGNMTQHVGFDGATTYFAYDAMHNKLLASWPDGRQIRYTYTASGQLASIIAGTTAPTISGFQAAGTTTFTYDVNDRPARVDYPSGRYIAYTYDSIGNLVGRATADGSWSYGYDPAQQLAQVTDPQGHSTQYSYDAMGRLTKTVYPDGTIRLQEYNAKGQLVQIASKNAQGSLLNGMVYTLLPNGQRQSMTRYDSQSTVQVTSQPYTNPTTHATTSVEHWTLTNSAATINYSYDFYQRLTQEQVQDQRNNLQRVTSWTYDVVGNRLSKTETVTPAGGASSTTTTSYTYDVADRLQQAIATSATASTVTTTYQWDQNGRVIRKASGSQVSLFTWRSDDKLVQVKQGATDATAQVIATYSYDDFGNRIQRVTQVPDPANPNSGTQVPQVTNYLVDDSFPYAETLEEEQNTNTQINRTLYTWGNDLISANLNSSLVGTPAQTYYEPDGLGSIITTSNANGQITANYRYDAFGKTYGVAAGDINPYRFTGQYFDAVTGIQYNRARWYDPDTALFLSMDPDQGAVAQPKSLPRYLYAEADPVNKVDPSGAVTLGEVMTAAEDAADMASEAIYTFQSVLGNPDDDGPENGPPTFFDNLMAYMIRVVGESLGDDDSSHYSEATLLLASAGGRGERHHTIPKYVCGHQSQDLSKIPVLMHRKLHRELYAFPVLIDSAGYAMKLLIFRRVTRPFPTPTQVLGRKKIGRAAISAGLLAFYGKFEYLEKGFPPIGIVFGLESPRFIAYHYNPVCEL